MERELRNRIDYFVVCVNDYADRHGIPAPDAFDYLVRHKGLDFLDECYDVEHTLSLETALADLEKPIGVSTYRLGLPPPDQLQSKLRRLLAAPCKGKISSSVAMAGKKKGK